MHLRIKTTSFLNRLNNLRSELNQHSVSIYIYIYKNYGNIFANNCFSVLTKVIESITVLNLKHNFSGIY